MKKPVLVIMAAGMGSRYGGLKQLDPVDEDGHIIMDFSIYDARRAGFKKVIFIIKEEFDAEFCRCIGDRISKVMEVSYVYQRLCDLPKGYEIPAGRIKPFGTGHAILSCEGFIDGPFAVINADDYYGVHALDKIYHYLAEHEDNETYQYAMVGYHLSNTLTEHGYVSRGVCEMDAEGFLTRITERTHIERTPDQTAYTEDDGNTWIKMNPQSIVSLNMFGFTASLIKELKERFPKFLDTNLKENPLKCEYFLPTVVGELIKERKAAVKVLETEDRWYGITYQEDKAGVVDAVRRMKAQGIYPVHLWKQPTKNMHKTTPGN